jgi:riboflavin synthase
MFTGIIQKIGIIKSISENNQNKIIEIEIPKHKIDYQKGESICINGICSTVINSSKNSFQVEYMPETLKLTTVNFWQKGDKLNLEASLKISDKLDGHFVLGHIDAIGEIIKIRNNKNSGYEIDISFPQKLSKFLAFKGSIAVDGVSLTISNLEENFFTISLIPYTLEHTNFSIKKEKDKVNLEIDLLMRYLKRLFDARDKETTYEFLKERGFI